VPTRPIPFFVEVGGVETSAIYQYLSAPVVGLFGLSVATTRVAAAASGTLTVALLFVLARGLALPGRREDEAPHDPAFRRIFPFAAMLFITLGPTHVLFSRWAQQGVTTPLLAAAGLATLLAVRGSARHARALSVLGGIALALAFYAYDPSRVVVPLLLLGLWWELAGPLRRNVRDFGAGAAAFLALAVPTTLFALGQGGARFARVSVFADRPLAEGLLAAAGNWLAHFDPRFLFLWGDGNARHAMPLAGMIGWVEIPFFLLGLVAIVRNLRAPGARLLLAWLLAGPTAAALTNEGIPHALRAILMIPALHLTSAWGAGWLATRIGLRRTTVALAVAGLGGGVVLVAGLGRLKRDPLADVHWQHGVLESLTRMEQIDPGGRHALSAEVPYAIYYALFFERTDPAALQELGGDALRTMIVPPGAPLPPGTWLARPNTDPFLRAGPHDIPHPGGDPAAPPVMRVTRAP
jgi:hypothetical protein